MSQTQNINPVFLFVLILFDTVSKNFRFFERDEIIHFLKEVDKRYWILIDKIKILDKINFKYLFVILFLYINIVIVFLSIIAYLLYKQTL